MLIIRPSARRWSPAELYGSGDDGDYYDISDVATLWQDTGATTAAVPASAHTVARVDGQRGVYNVTQPTAAREPASGVATGIYSLTCDGNDTALQNTSVPANMLATDPVTVFMGVKTTTRTAGDFFWRFNYAAGPTADFNLSINDTDSRLTQFFNRSTTNVTERVGGLTSNAVYYTLITDTPGSSDNTAANFDIYLDNSLQANVSSTNGSGTMTNPPDEIFWFNNHTENSGLDGIVQCWGFINRAITSAERALLDTWIKSKQGR